MIAFSALFAVAILGSGGTAQSAPSDDVFMAGGRTSVARGFELFDNRMFLSVWINGQGPYKFILDSGATNLLTLETAKALGLPLQPAERQSGAGAGSVESWTTRVDSLKLGDLELTNQTCAVVSLDPIMKAIGFQRLDGVLGYELFRQLVVTLDFESNNATFQWPETFTPPTDGWTTVPFEMSDHIPVVSGAVDHLEGRFLIDTGDRSALTLFSPFADLNSLYSRYNATPEVTTGWGIGGPVPARVARVDTLIIGSFPLRDVITRMSTLKSGSFATSEQAGSIGNGVLNRFTVVFDYPNRRLFLKPNKAQFRHDPWDGAGMWLALCDEGFEVKDVMKGGPAAEAGIKTGDVVLTVNGMLPANQSLIDVRRLLSDVRPGAVVRLVLKGTPDNRIVDLTLKKIL